jgi:hypothetical protein
LGGRSKAIRTCTAKMPQGPSQPSERTDRPAQARQISRASNYPKQPATTSWPASCPASWQVGEPQAALRPAGHQAGSHLPSQPAGQPWLGGWAAGGWPAGWLAIGRARTLVSLKNWIMGSSDPIFRNRRSNFRSNFSIHFFIAFRRRGVLKKIGS